MQTVSESSKQLQQWSGHLYLFLFPSFFLWLRLSYMEEEVVVEVVVVLPPQPR